ncbi:MAG: hypothetical protein J6P65_00455 [Bacteroidales bacterium]|nr:hypothetical protein [Bacteroidales bacterium]
MIVITGAAGFIGSCMVQHLNKSGRDDLVLVDDFPVTPVDPGHDVLKIASCPDVETFPETSPETSPQTMRYVEKVPRDFFFDWAAQNMSHIDFILHFGVESVGMQADAALLREYSLEFSQRLWSLASMNRIPLLYAAASTEAKWNWTVQEWTVRGSGMAEAERLKRQFDQWVLKQRVMPPLWAGFAMPEVYGPNETQLGNAASSVYQLFNQWQREGRMVIPLYRDSEDVDNEPVMDRIFVKDVVTVFTWFMNHLPASGFYYLGAGYPRPLSAVAAAIFSALKLPAKVEYQIISSAETCLSQEKNLLPLNRINRIGYKKNFTPLEKGVRLYVKNILNE